MKRLTLLAVCSVVLGLVLSGCPENKKKGADSADPMGAAGKAMRPVAPVMAARPAAMGMTVRPAAMGMTARPAAMGVGMDPAAKGEPVKLGVPECDAYIKAMKCVVDKSPAAGQAAARAVFNAAYGKLKSQAASAKRALMGRGCAKAHDLWKTTMAKQSYAKDCLK